MPPGVGSFGCSFCCSFRVGDIITKVVQERLGHHSSAFTIDTYQAFIPGMGAQAARRFEGLVFGGADPGSDTDSGET